MAEEQKRVLAVMAHPDDIEILIGGTLIKLASEGWRPGMVTMTSGDCGSDDSRTKEEITRIRHGEARAAADSINAWYACAGEMDVEVIFGREQIRKTVELIRTFAPEVVITHSPSDYMLDHEETSKIVRSAVFAAAAPLYQTGATSPADPVDTTPVLYYADPVEGTDYFGNRIQPGFYIDISNEIEEKKTLLGYHSSQRDWLRIHHGVDEYLDRMIEWAQRYGRECSADYAEGFRQHLGHGYPHEPILQRALQPFVRRQPGKAR